MKEIWEWTAGAMLGVVTLFAGWLKISYDRRFDEMKKELDCKATKEELAMVEGQAKAKVDISIYKIQQQAFTETMRELRDSQKEFIARMDRRLEQGDVTMHRLELLITEVKKDVDKPDF